MPEKRKYKRLAATLAVSCYKVGGGDEFYSGRTVNVSPGGLLFETRAGVFTAGNLIRVELSIPPTVGLLELGGRISVLAKVLRTDEVLEEDSVSTAARYGVAVQFCQSPRLCP